MQRPMVLYSFCGHVVNLKHSCFNWLLAYSMTVLWSTLNHGLRYTIYMYILVLALNCQSFNEIIFWLLNCDNNTIQFIKSWYLSAGNANIKSTNLFWINFVSHFITNGWITILFWLLADDDKPKIQKKN